LDKWQSEVVCALLFANSTRWGLDVTGYVDGVDNLSLRPFKKTGGDARTIGPW